MYRFFWSVPQFPHAQTAVYSKYTWEDCHNCNRNSRASPILKKLHWLPVEFRCIFKTATYKFISFSTVVTQTISALICLFIAEGMAQDTTAHIRGSRGFLNFTHLYTNRKKHFGHSFAFDAPTLWNDLPDDVRSCFNSCLFQEKTKILSL